MGKIAAVAVLMSALSVMALVPPPAEGQVVGCSAAYPIGLSSLVCCPPVTTLFPPSLPRTLGYLNLCKWA